MTRPLRVEYSGAIYHISYFVESGLMETDEEFLQELELSPRGIGDEKFRSWVDEKHQLMQAGLNEDDVMFRKDREWAWAWATRFSKWSSKWKRIRFSPAGLPKWSTT
jgi:hypothetical protein